MKKEIKSSLLDTSFLLKSTDVINSILQTLTNDKVHRFITKTIYREIETLFLVGRIGLEEYDRAIARYKGFKCRLIAQESEERDHAIREKCIISMEEHHGVRRENIRNDCSILATAIDNNIDLVLSEDFHFTSRVTDRVVKELCDKSCPIYQRICNSDIILINKDTFMMAYSSRKVDLDLIEKIKENVIKSGKRYQSIR